MDCEAKQEADEALEKILTFFDCAPEGDEWETSRRKLRTGIQKNRISLNEETATITMKLLSPISDGDIDIKELVFHEPTAGDLKEFDRYKDAEKMQKMVHLAAKMSGKKIAIIDKMGARDLQTMAAVASLFF